MQWVISRLLYIFPRFGRNSMHQRKSQKKWKKDTICSLMITKYGNILVLPTWLIFFSILVLIPTYVLLSPVSLSQKFFYLVSIKYCPINHASKMHSIKTFLLKSTIDYFYPFLWSIISGICLQKEMLSQLHSLFPYLMTCTLFSHTCSD